VAATTAILFTKIVVEKSSPVLRWQRPLPPFDEGSSDPDETDAYNQYIIMSKNNFLTPCPASQFIHFVLDVIRN